MLALSQVVILATAGLSLGAACVHVWRVARRTGVPRQADRLLVLGMQLKDGRLERDYRLRLLRARRLARRRPGVRLVIVGGQTDAQGPSEARAGAQFLESRGIEPGLVQLEDASRHTLENLCEARALLSDDEVQRVALITSRYHLARSLAMARSLGMDLIPCPAEPRWSAGLAGVFKLVHEAWLLHWYHTGRVYARLMNHRGMLSRIS
ncbi:MAG: YdcF family protein [Thioalkalivibrio sp.]